MTDPPPTHAPIPEAKGMAVFLCRCQGTVSEKVDLDALMEWLLSHPRVRSVDVMDECCRDEDKDRMLLALRSGEVDRMLIAGCSYKLLSERMFQVARGGGIDPYMVEICNLKEQCALVHDKGSTQSKAERLLDISLQRCLSMQVPPHSEGAPASRTIMVLGGGHSACVAAKEAYLLKHEVIMVNASDHIADEAHGEEMINLEEGSFEQFLGQAGDAITVLNDTRLTDLRGHPGRFQAVLDTPLGETELSIGAVVVALDLQDAPNPLAERYHGEIQTQHDLGEALRAGSAIPRHVVMLAMDEVGESAFDPLSTHEAVHNALFLRSTRPKCTVTMITREVFAFGQCEAGYNKAMETGVRVLRSDRLPKQEGKELIVSDIHLGGEVSIPFDLLVLDNATAIPDTSSLARAIGIPIDAQGRFLRPNAKLRPSSTLREGVFLCGGAAERSLGIGPSLEAMSATVMASDLLGMEWRNGGEVAEVWPDKCSACLTCVRICPYRAASIGGEGKASIDISLCQGCGICVGMCPSKAIQQYSFRDDQIEMALHAALRRESE